ncbi:MAG: nitrate/nitrite transporter NrtS [Pseudomonadota bacterium]
MPASYFEIPADDLERARRFYAEVIGIPSEEGAVDGYRMAFFPDVGDGRANGALAEGDVYRPGKHGALVYLEVSSIDDVLKRLAEFGAEPLLAKQRADEHGFIAEIEDSEGNRVGLHERERVPDTEMSDATFWSLAMSSRVLPRSLRVAVVVGTLLFIINYGDRLLSGGLLATDALKIGLTYLVPYGVATWSAVSALRERASQV